MPKKPLPTWIGFTRLAAERAGRNRFGKVSSSEIGQLRQRPKLGPMWGAAAPNLPRPFGIVATRLHEAEIDAEMGALTVVPQPEWRGVAAFWATPHRALALALQVLDSGRNNFGLVLAIVSTVAVMQVAIDPDKPAFGAFL